MRRLVLILALLWPLAAAAVTPDEMLPDPAQEARAREISRLLRCPVCQGETIDDSGADIAADLRVLVRERILAGDSNEEVIKYIVDRYGEYVLFLPPARGVNLVLWIAGPVMLLLALMLAWMAARRRRASATPSELNAEEQARLEQILKN
ncbi:cytochrome c-type biogenesis protein [Frigidibacter sp. ROC022]|uniref:cytochrome c-type biogenesis protein n=1 Tax=Frigidibacter sp. ROC022 TaxID=2971796 RepID=UPI00215B65A6|nr:cytochrome c-type biogenesis protein [Frigidibacter sp. ROC022]MCR8725465.1 cytochrome c-type biogenesis protein CcmH [Frigidibacter sp. ROC022]